MKKFIVDTVESRFSFPCEEEIQKKLENGWEPFSIIKQSHNLYTWAFKKEKE